MLIESVGFFQIHNLKAFAVVEENKQHLAEYALSQARASVVAGSGYA